MFDFLLGNDLLSAILAFGIVLIPAVIVHEFGHFLAAKSIGITVLEFGIGFPPRIARLFTWRETEFTLNAIPLGGYVRPLGEDIIRPVSEEETDQQRAALAQDDIYQSEREELAARGFHDTMAVNEAKPWPRIGFMAAGPIANFIFAFLLFVFIGLIGLPEEVGARLGLSNVTAGSAVYDTGLRTNDLIESVNGEYFASTEDLVRRLEMLMGEEVTVTITRQNEGESIEMFDMILLVTQDLLDGFDSAVEYVLITSVYDESPAGEAGLRPGDLIAEFNDEQVAGTPDPIGLVQSMTLDHAGESVTLSVLRDGEIREISLVPRTDPPVGQGRMGIGIRAEYAAANGNLRFVEVAQVESVAQPPNIALEYGVERVTTIFGLIAEFPARLLSNDTEPEERRIVSAVGVSQLGGAILQDTIEEDEPVILLEYIALISIALGFTNLLPIPALDGGRILFVIVELIRGKPMEPEREGMVHLVGLIFILSIGVIFIINDLLNPLTDVLP
jgi:regulator of sigma E protease